MPFARWRASGPSWFFCPTNINLLPTPLLVRILRQQVEYGSGPHVIPACGVKVFRFRRFSLGEDSQINFSTHNVKWTLWGGGFGSGRYRFKIDFFLVVTIGHNWGRLTNRFCNQKRLLGVSLRRSTPPPPPSRETCTGQNYKNRCLSKRWY